MSRADFLPATSYPLPATSAKPIVFGCYGAARREKGSDIFQEAIKRILKNEVASGDPPSRWRGSGVTMVTSNWWQGRKRMIDKIKSNLKISL